jgi:DNA-binding GntR family transcriptional regulator
MPRLENQTLRERVHDHLKQEILAGHYPPGSELLEVPLSKELGVSRGPIREALWSLETEGLVQITPRRGAVVISLTKRDFLETYQVREALEVLGVRQAVPLLDEAALDRLNARNEDMAEHAARGDVDAFFEENAAFHQALVEGSDNRKLVEVYRRLIAQMGPYRLPSARLRGNLEQSVAEHGEIIAAMHDRDVGRAVEKIMKHIEVPQRMLETMSDEQFVRSAGLPRAS